MSLLTVIAAIVVVGVLLYVVNRFIPMDGNARSILNAVVVILLVVWLLKEFGVIAWLDRIHI